MQKERRQSNGSNTWQTTLRSCGGFYYQNRYLSIDRLWIIKEEQMNTTAATICS